MSHIDVQTLIGVTTLLTFLSPYIAAVFTQQHFPRWLNELIAFCVSIVFGIISWLSSGGTFHDVHDIGSLYTSVTLVMVGAKIYYLKLAKASPILPALEWLTGGKQSGFAQPAAAFSASTGVDEDAMPDMPTDTPVNTTNTVSPGGLSH